MTRLLPALTAGVCCALLGLRRSRDIRARHARLERWTSLTAHLALLLQEEAGSLPEILRTAASEEQEPDRILRAVADQLIAVPLSDALILPDLLSPEEAQPLRRLLDRLTQGSRDSRVQAAAACSEVFAQLAQCAREKSDADAKMWRQLGLLGGACLTLWLM